MDAARAINEQGIAVRFTSHQVRHVLDHADRIIALKGGWIALDAPSAVQDPDELPIVYHAARGLVAHAARGLVALFRTVPDLVWALLFVIAVGLGPFAGTLELVADTIGFCGRFFAEAMEVEEGPQEALTALEVAFDMFQYDLAATISLSIFVLVLAVERLGAQAGHLSGG